MTQARTYQAYHTIATTTARVQLSSPGKERGGEGREWLARDVCVFCQDCDHVMTAAVVHCTTAAKEENGGVRITWPHMMMMAAAGRSWWVT